MSQNADGHTKRLEYEPSRPGPIRRDRCIILATIYLAATFIAVQLLEPALTPPGFTGRGTVAMILPILGAFHLAKCPMSLTMFFAFGCLGAMLLIPSYFDNRLGLSIGLGHRSISGIVTGWVAFVLAIGLLTSLSAAARRYIERYRTPGTRM